MVHRAFKTFKLLSLYLVISALIACGGSSQSTDNKGTEETTSNNASNDTSTNISSSGTVAVLLTDAPADPDLFLAINVSIESIELLSANEDSNQLLYSGPTKVIDLFDLKNESMPFSFQEGIATGEYCKIRLTLSDLELVFVDDTPEDNNDNETHHPKLPGNNKLDLSIRDCISVESGEVLTIQLDMDAGKSIHITGNKDKYQFRPVVFVDALVENFNPKLLRLQGELVSYDETLNTLLFCDALPTDGIANNGCTEIHINSDTAFFDNVLYSGSPRSTFELFNDDKLNQEFTILGWPRYQAPDYIDVHIPKGHYPPLGMCKLWDITKVPGHQSAAIDCDDIEDIPENFVLVNDSGLVRDLNRPIMIIDALSIQQGEFLQVNGEAREDASETDVSIKTLPGSPVISQSLKVSFFEDQNTANGTRCISKAGEHLDCSSILEGTTLHIEGVLESLPADSVYLNAALVIIDTNSTNDSSAIEGFISSIDTSGAVITLENEELCGTAISQMELNLNDNFDILTVAITDDSSEINSGGTFNIDQKVAVYGYCQSTALQTRFQVESVIILHDTRDEL